MEVPHNEEGTLVAITLLSSLASVYTAGLRHTGNRHIRRLLGYEHKASTEHLSIKTMAAPWF